MARLREVGLGPQVADSTSPPGAALVFFVEVSTGLCDFLRETSRGGKDRVIAVSMSRTALSGGASWTLLQSGASDVVVWDDPAAAARHVAARMERWAAVDEIIGSTLVQSNLVGQSRAWTSALRHIVEVAKFTDAPVLIEGESGTGKELVARLIHLLDSRSQKKELVLLDCTTIVPELSGSEFFGHERGAYTGAAGMRDGAFALADGGTLFLDEVGELPLPLQAQLLRVVQERTYKRVGGNSWHNTHFRLVCATNRDVAAEVERGSFRRDLYYRIASMRCRLPPLRERADDILHLARHFIRAHQPGATGDLDESVKEYLLSRDYPGNVRDLRQLMARMLHKHVGPGPLTVGDLPDSERPQSGAGEDWREGPFESAVRRALAAGAGLKDIGRAAEDVAVRVAVEEEGNLQKAASRLGVTDRALQMRRANRRMYS